VQQIRKQKRNSGQSNTIEHLKDQPGSALFTLSGRDSMFTVMTMMMMTMYFANLEPGKLQNAHQGASYAPYHHMASIAL
jgi:hypothetical protein